MTDDLTGLLSSVGFYILGPMAIGAASYAVIRISDYLKNRTRHWHINISAEKNEKIQEKLTELRITLNADRTYLSMFHNGFKYADGSEVLKKSRTNESVAEGITFEAEKYRNLMISHMNEEMMLVKKGDPVFALVSDLPDSKFKRMLVSSRIKAIVRCSLKKNADTIGFLGADFMSLDKSPTNLDEMGKYAGIIEQILSTYR